MKYFIRTVYSKMIVVESVVVGDAPNFDTTQDEDDDEDDTPEEKALRQVAKDLPAAISNAGTLEPDNVTIIKRDKTFWKRKSELVKVE